MFDGNIITKFENYYVEPSQRYSTKLHRNGIHSIIYKTSDVKIMPYLMSLNTYPSSIKEAKIKEPVLHSEGNGHYCASERLRKKMKNDFKRRRKNVSGNESRVNIPRDNSSSKLVKTNSKWRIKRWLPDEVCETFF